jgi:hypothetical protein
MIPGMACASIGCHSPYVDDATPYSLTTESPALRHSILWRGMILFASL